jgi:ADP-ribose pyrophosphatase YjhB (NUDIX family)
VRYCSSCGGRVSEQLIEGFRRFVCEHCAETHFANPRIIVACAVCWKDKVLMGRRALEPALGEWAIPTGYLEMGETLEEGAAREAHEETGIVLAPEKLELCSVINMTSIRQVAIIFRIVLDSLPVLKPGSEYLEVAFLANHEVPHSQFAWRQTMGDGPERFYRELVSQQFTIQLITLGTNDGTGFRSREYAIASVHESLPAVGKLDEVKTRKED